MSSINIIDTVRDKIYCLYEEKNYKHKFRKATIIPRDFQVKGAAKDQIQYQLVYVTEQSPQDQLKISQGHTPIMED